jgi:AcrR family transcriptional regulator
MNPPESGTPAERDRIVEAVIEELGAGHEASPELDAVLERAEVDEATFRSYFPDLEEAYIEIVAGMDVAIKQRIGSAVAATGSWQEGIRAMGEAIFEFIVEDPRRARFMFLGTLCFGERVQIMRDETVSLLTVILDQGRAELDDPESLSPATAEAIVGAVYHQLRTHIAQGEADDPAALAELCRQLIYLALQPYLGAEAALTEMRKPWPVPASHPARGYPGSVSEEELGPLPAGRHGLSREQVAHSQRERLVAGFATAVAEQGYHATTIAHITKAASVSRRVFYENFEDKEQCFLAAYDIVIAHLHELMDEAGRDVEDWPHRAVAELSALLRFLASEPDLARLILVEALRAGPVVAERYREGLLSFVPRLEQGRRLRASDRALPDSREASLLGGLASLLSSQVTSGRTEQMTDLLPDLTEFLLTPYLGPEEAERLASEAA